MMPDPNLPPDFAWPENSIDDLMPPLQSAQDHEGAISAGFSPGDNPRNTASHNLPDVDIWVAPETNQDSPPPFSVKQITESGLGFELLLHPGRVSIANPVQAANGGDGYDYFIPEIDGEPMDEELLTGGFPLLAIGAGEAVYAKVNRDVMGFIIPPVELVADVQGKDSDHYQPQDPNDSGHESQFDFIRILYLDVDNGATIIKNFRESDIDLTPFLWTGENDGGFARVFKEHKEIEGVYKFRTIRGCWGASAAEDGDIIKVEVEAENIGDDGGLSAGTGATILVEKTDEDPAADLCEEKLKFKTLRQGSAATRQQIEIVNEDDVARIQGNGIDGAMIFRNCDDIEIGRMEWQDGLMLTAGDQTIIVGDCSASPPPPTTPLP